MVTIGRSFFVLPVLSVLLTTGLNAQIQTPTGRQGGSPLNVRGDMANPAPTVRLDRQEQSPSYAGVRRLVPSQYATVQAAIDSSHNGDTVLVAENTYKENIRFKGKAITVASLYLIDGDTAHIAGTILDGSAPLSPDSGSVVYCINGEDTTSVLCGLTIRGGSGTHTHHTSGWVRNGGGMYCESSGAKLVRNIFRENRVIDKMAYGGGVAFNNLGAAIPWVVLDRNSFSDNYVRADSALGWAYSGGADFSRVSLRMVGNLFERDTVLNANYAVGAGCSFSGMVNENPTFTGYIAGNIFRRNLADASAAGGTHAAVGGGLYLGATGVTQFVGNVVQENRLISAAGGWAEGGGICIDDENVGGAGRKTVTGNQFIGNTAQGQSGAPLGGGLDLYHSYAVVSGNIFSGNSASGVSSGQGGGFRAFMSSFRVDDNVFVGNSSGLLGGGVQIASGPDHGTGQFLVNNSFNGNSAQQGGAVNVDYGADVILLNNIMWGDYAAAGAEMIPGGGSINAQYNDVQGGWPAGIGNINADPKYADASLRLSPGSPCLGRGMDSIQVGGIWYKAPRADFFGAARPDPPGSLPDMGACESPLRETVRRTVPGQYATIQAAIDAAAHGDTVLVSENTYKENIRFRGKHIIVASQYLLDKDTTHIAKTVIDGSGSTSADSGSTVSFVNGEDTTSVLCGFTITGGTGTKYRYSFQGTEYAIRAGGGIFCNLAGARIVKNAITRNRITAPFPTGGGVEIYGSATVTPVLILEFNRITENVLEGSATGTGEWASSAGADYCGANGRVVNNVFERDTARGYEGAYGGGLGVTFYNIYGPLVSVQITGNTFRANVVRGTVEGAVGGGVLVQGTGEMKVADNVFEGNSAVSFGGWAEGGGLCVTDQGQGTYGRKSIEHNQFLNNTVQCGNTCEGGGLLIYRTLATVARNVFAGNAVTAGVRGDDDSPAGGAGLFAFRAAFTIENNIFRKNLSVAHGAGMGVAFPPQIGSEQVVVNNTFTGNVADGAGGAMRIYSAPSTILFNTICWKDSAKQTGSEIVVDYGVAAVSNCMIRGGWPSGTAIVTADPMFADSTQLMLSPSSACIGHGADSLQVGGVWYKAPIVDINGNPRGRPIGTRIDIGAVEEPLVDVPHAPESVPTTYAMEQNYPNPFNPSTVICFQLPSASHVTLTVYNLLGQLVAKLMDEKKEPGQYEVRWDAAGFPSGVYFYRLEAGDFRNVRKMMLLK